jgi:hypothetical protein
MARHYKIKNKNMKTYLKTLVSPQLPEDIGEIHIEWKFPEFVKQNNGKWWYIVVAGIIALFLIYALVTMNILFAVILVLGVFVILYQFFQIAKQIPVIIGEDGIIVDKTFYPYRTLQNFWIIYQPPSIKYLYLGFKSDMKRGLPIPLEDINPMQLREVLLNYLEEDLEKDEEDFDETFSRLLNIR